MSNNWLAAFVMVIACTMAAMGAYSGMHLIMVVGIVLPVIVSLFRLPEGEKRK